MAVQIFILLPYGTKSWNWQIADTATLFTNSVIHMEILQEQFSGLIVSFSFALATCTSSDIQARIFLDKYNKNSTCSPNTFGSTVIGSRCCGYPAILLFVFFFLLHMSYCFCTSLHITNGEVYKIKIK